MEDIRQLEEDLLKPSIRRSAVEVSRLLAEDFQEIGASGRIFTREDVIFGLEEERPVHRTVADYKTKPLSEHLYLATYTVTSELGTSLRSSIWRKTDSSWELVFHQGTPKKANQP
ncbi:DUF4440 domain-containing protein [Marinococcus sp. PL1-022]|uniref:nuclear transport factor 2 family protein n=1 Tax=Marinococcus sp. PL1-022 TaxID=3095363 RepID=UPI0029C45D41|nr:DUF4440 domain-containing protein [Marinococcus sp. PL1-022]MDX6151538.1 DUF4440 domain-containing protein [Marinococcus sp. PL1-022]